MVKGFFKFKVPKISMQEETTHPPEVRRKPADEFIMEKHTTERKSLLSFIPKKIQHALKIGIVVVASFFISAGLGSSVHADELTLPPNTESILSQKEYSFYSTSPDIDSFKVALFYVDSITGETLPFSEQGYFLTTSGETLWTSTTDTIHGEGPEEGIHFWIVKVKGEKVLPSERESRGGTYHGTPQDSLFKEIIEEKMIYGDPNPLYTYIDYWALDSVAGIGVSYTGGSETWILYIFPPTDTIYIDELELKVIEDGVIKPTEFKKGLAYPNPFNSVVTLLTDDRVGPVMIFDSSGKRMLGELFNESNEVKWDASKFNSGKYFAVWKNKEGSYTVTSLTLIK